MANQTLYSVGVGDFIAYKGGQLFAIGKFDTETSMEFTASYLDIRGGKRGKLLARYAHSSNATFSIIAANYSPEILAASMGGQKVENYGYVPFEESLEVKAGRVITLSNTPKAVGDIPANVWVRYNGKTYSPIAYNNSLTITLPNTEEYNEIPTNANVCAVYQYQNLAAADSTFSMPAEVEPAILHIFVDIDLVGDESGSGVIGHQVVEIPLAQLNPEQTINATMDGYSQSRLTGVMLADKSASTNACGGQGVYAYITTVINDANWYDDVYAIVNDVDDLELGNSTTATINLLGLQAGGKYMVIGSSYYGDLTFTFDAGTATGTTFDSETGVITTSTTDGTATLKVKVTGVTRIKEYTLEINVA